MRLGSPPVNQSRESCVDERRLLSLELKDETEQSGSPEVRRIALLVLHLHGIRVTPHAQWREHLSKSGRQKLVIYFYESENFGSIFRS